jgi:hypothetical protein
MPVLRHVNEKHVVPEIKFLKCLHRLVVTTTIEAMDGQLRFAARSCMADGFGGRVSGQARRIAASERFVISPNFA